jgi:hypothetical protein
VPAASDGVCFRPARGRRKDWTPAPGGFTEHQLPDVEFLVLAPSVGNAANHAYPPYPLRQPGSRPCDVLHQVPAPRRILRQTHGVDCRIDSPHD